MPQTQTPPTSKVTDDQLAKWEQLTRDLVRRNDMDSDGFQAFMGYPHLGAEMDKIVRKALKNAKKPTPVIVIELTDSQQRAKAIMGKNFFGPEEAANHFKAGFTQEQSDALATVPFSDEVLEACKDKHVLVAGYPMTILNVRAKAKRGLFYSYGDSWYNNQKFAKDEQVEVRWYLIRKTPVDNSTSKNWNEQQALLAAEEETPKACVVVYTIIGHFLNTGERLFENIYVRCSDIDSDGDSVLVGHFNSDGLFVGRFWDDIRISDLGLSARKLS